MVITSIPFFLEFSLLIAFDKYYFWYMTCYGPY